MTVKRRSSVSSPVLSTPAPLLISLSALALAGVVALAASVAGVSWLGALTVIISLLLAGGLLAVHEWNVLRNRRRVADRWLLWGAEARPASELLTWRAAELTSRRSRKILAGSLRRLRREAEGRLVPGALPLNRLEIRSQIGLLRALESRLAELTQPVSPRGVLLVEQILTEPGSPLYSWERSGQLARQLSEACAALDPIEGRDVLVFPPQLSAGFGAEPLSRHVYRTLGTGGR